MSKWNSTKFKFFTLTLVVTLSVTSLVHQHNVDQQALFQACMAVDSNLPINHQNHPCQAHYLSNQSWWSWLKGESHSSYFRALDFIELVHKFDLYR